MKKKAIQIHKKLLVLKDFASENKEKLDQYPQVRAAMDSQLEFIPRLNKAMQKQSIKYTGFAVTKKQFKIKLCQSLIQVMDLLYTRAYANKMTDDIVNFKVTLSKLKHTRNLILVDKAETIIDYCESHSDEIVTIGISEKMLTTLKDDARNFKNYIPLPKEKKVVAKSATVEIVRICKESDEYEKNQLDKVMAAFFQESDPQLYWDYRQSLMVENPGSRKLAVTGVIKNRDTQQPITRAYVLIPQAGIKHLCKGAKGGFRIPNLEAGTYEMEVRAVNFITKKLTLVHNFGETDRLDVMLEPELEK